MRPKDADGMANSVDPDQTAPIWVCSVCPDLSNIKVLIVRRSVLWLLCQKHFVSFLETSREIMVLSVLCKLILQMRMHSYPVGPDVWFLVGLFFLLPSFICANSEGSGQTVRMCRLAWAFAGCLCDKYHKPRHFVQKPYLPVSFSWILSL